MGDEEEGSDDDTGLKGLKSSIDELTDPSTSVEAQDYARQILGRNLKEPNSAAEADLMTRMENQASDARAKLQAAREKLAARRINPAEGWFALSAALGSPTKTGSLGETIGNAAGSMVPFLQHKRDFEGEQDKELLGIDSQLNGIDTAQIQERLKALQSKQSNDTRMSVAALNMLGKRTRGGASGQMSPQGKQAQDEGNVPGTPGFNNRVKELVAIDIANHKATSGTDVPPPDQTGLQDLASSVGVPIAPNPFSGLSSKDARQARQQAMKDAQKQLDAFADQDSTSNDAINEAHRFDKLIDQAGVSGAGVGVIRNIPILGKALAPMMGADKNSQQLDAITAELSRKVRTPGEGSTSDFDAQQFINATLDRAKGPEANHTMAKAFIQKNQNNIARHQFFQDYYSVNHHIQGAASAWQKYLNDNPIFDKTKPGAYQLNPNRVDYKTYFRGLTGDHGTPVVTEGGAGYDEDPGSATSTEVTPDDNLPAIEKKGEGGAIKGAAKALSESDLARLLGKALSARKVPPSDLAPLASLRNPDLDHLVSKYTGQFDRNSFDPVTSAQDQLSDALMSIANRQSAPGYASGGEVDTGSVNGDPDALEQESWEDAARSLGQGATFGFEDELSGHKHSERDKLQKNHESHPTLDTFLQALGTAGPATLAARAFPEVGVPTALSAAALSALTSQTGSGEGDTMNSTVPAGSVLGTLAGGAAGGIGYSGSKAIDSILDKTRFGIGSDDKSVLEAMNSDRMTPEEVGKSIMEGRRTGVPSMALDELGPSTARLAQMAMQQGSGDAGQLTQTMIDRQDDARPRAEAIVNKALKPDPYLQTEKDLLSRRSDEAKDAYNKLYSDFPGVKSSVLFELMKTPAGKEAAKDAFRAMQNDQVPIGVADAKGMVRNPSLQYLDYYKQALDAKIRHAKMNPDSKNSYSSLTGMKQRFVQGVDAATTDPATGRSPYAEARAQYGDTSSIIDALHSGREDFASETPESIQRKVSGMSYADKDAYKSGIAEQLFRGINKPSGEGVNAAQRIAGSPDTMAKLQAVLDPGEFKVMSAGLQREAAMYSRSRSVLKNAGKLPGDTPQTKVSVGDWLRDFLPSNRMSENDAESIARTLRVGTNADVKAMMERLGPKAKALAKRGTRAKAIGLGASIVGGTLASPNAKPQLPGDTQDISDDEDQ